MKLQNTVHFKTCVLKIRSFFQEDRKYIKNQTSFSTPERSLNFVVNEVNIRTCLIPLKQLQTDKFYFSQICLYILKKKIK